MRLFPAIIAAIDGRIMSTMTHADLSDGRGRNAEAPSHIGWKGWKDILYRVYS